MEEAELRLVSYDDDSFKRSGTSQTQKSLSASEVIETAETYAMNPDRWEDYHVLTNNCEHFCIFCKTGKKVNAFDSDIMDQTKNMWVSLIAIIYMLRLYYNVPIL